MRSWSRVLAIGVLACLVIFGSSVLVFVEGDSKGLICIWPVFAAIYIAVPIGLSLRHLEKLHPTSKENGDILVRAGGGMFVVAPLLWILAPSFEHRPGWLLGLSAVTFVVTAAVLARSLDTVADLLAGQE